jgi:hypothetical protein
MRWWNKIVLVLFIVFFFLTIADGIASAAEQDNKVVLFIASISLISFILSIVVIFLAYPDRNNVGRRF